jgi:glycoprotein-N-acetylgalactosamine 3-beta-galactosyltransferase
LILTTPQYFDTRARAVNSTWAPRCDKFSFISEYSNDTKGLPIAPLANISSGYGHLTQKTTLAFHYVYEKYLNDFDWFVKADDDTYIFVDNLKSFLKEQNPSEPITFGHNFNENMVKNRFNNTVNKTLQNLLPDSEKNHDKHVPRKVGEFVSTHSP